MITIKHYDNIEKHMKEEIEYMKSILPAHYEVKETKGGVNCKSRIGLKQDIDADDDEHYGYIVKAVKQKFGERFQEIFHQVNSCHMQFTVFIKRDEK